MSELGHRKQEGHLRAQSLGSSWDLDTEAKVEESVRGERNREMRDWAG